MCVFFKLQDNFLIKQAGRWGLISFSEEGGNSRDYDDIQIGQIGTAEIYFEGQKRPPLVILPYSHRKEKWDRFILLMVLINAIFVPFFAAFDVTGETWNIIVDSITDG